MDVDCDFEVDMCGWNQSVPVQEDDSTWERHQGPTETAFTGPSNGHGGVGTF